MGWWHNTEYVPGWYISYRHIKTLYEHITEIRRRYWRGEDACGSSVDRNRDSAHQRQWKQLTRASGGKQNLCVCVGEISWSTITVPPVLFLVSVTDVALSVSRYVNDTMSFF